MSLNNADITQPDIRKSQTDVTTFCVLLFISINLFIASIYSIYRESYAVDPGYLKRVRSILVVTTILQIVCFSGYWLNIYLMYEIAWLIWLTLSTFSIMFMGIKFGQSYIILVTPNYSLKDHNKIPNKYIILTFSFWFIGSCIDITGTMLGLFLKQFYAQSICYAVWEILCCVSVGFVIFILKRVRSKFNDIMTAKLSYNEDKKETKRKNKKKRKIANKLKQQKQRQSAIHSIPEDHVSYHNIDDPKIEISQTNHIIESSHRGNSVLSTYTMTGSALTASTASTVSTAGSINDSLLTNTGSVIKSEIKRMRNLICGLYLMIVVFMLNAIFNGFYRFSQTLFTFNESDYNNGSIYTLTPTLVVATIFFPQWTVINMFVLMFSWIPHSQMKDEWDEL